jgi:hypothetical protein
MPLGLLTPLAGWYTGKIEVEEGEGYVYRK